MDSNVSYQNIRLALAVTIIGLSIAGCSTRKDFYATGGSRADGVIDVAYDYNRMETPVVDKKQAYSIAKSKCSLWGYGDAEPFGGQLQTCQARSGFGECSAWQVVIKYQCLGGLEQPFTPPNYLGTSAPTRAVPQQAQSRQAIAAPAVTAPPMDPQEYKEFQLQQLMQKNLPYDEYQKQYRAIMDR